VYHYFCTFFFKIHNSFKNYTHNSFMEVNGICASEIIYLLNTPPLQEFRFPGIIRIIFMEVAYSITEQAVGNTLLFSIVCCFSRSWYQACISHKQKSNLKFWLPLSVWWGVMRIQEVSCIGTSSVNALIIRGSYLSFDSRIKNDQKT